MNQLISLTYDKYIYSKIDVIVTKNLLQVSGRLGFLQKKWDTCFSSFILQKQFLFFPMSEFKLFLSLISDLIIGVSFQWFIELEMKGLGFKTFFSAGEKIYKIDLGYNHYIFYSLRDVNLAVKTKRRSRFIIVYGLDKMEVLNLVWKILAFRPLTAYKFRGIKFRHEDLKLKIGKKKQFI